MSSRRTGAQIIDAIAKGAADLFLERSPSAVSVRQIAEAANVNLGLIHRYVGSKDDVIALVLERHTERARNAIAGADGISDLLDVIADAVVARPETGKLMAGLILDGVDITGAKQEFPLLTELASDQGEVQAALTYALALGWEVFGPSLLEAVGASPTETQLRQALARSLKSVRSA